MSNALAQSATTLSKSANGEDNFDFMLYVSEAAKQSVKSNSITRERQALNRQKLISKVCANYRNTFAEIYGKSDRLPTDVFSKIEKAVDDYITKQLCVVNSTNVISMRRGFYVNVKDMSVSDRVTLVGENALALKEQHLGIQLFISQIKRRISDLEKTADNVGTWKAEQLESCNERLKRLQAIQLFIEREIKSQAPVTSTAG